MSKYVFILVITATGISCECFKSKKRVVSSETELKRLKEQPVRAYSDFIWGGENDYK